MKKYIISMVLCTISFALGYHQGDLERSYLIESNQRKAECLAAHEKAYDILANVIDSHADDGCWDEQVDELVNNGYFKSLKVVDSLYECEK